VDAANDELKLLEGELSSVQELKFAFRRAASRLTEMAGKEYLKNWQLRYKTASA
jgi:predicted ATPase